MAEVYNPSVVSEYLRKTIPAIPEIITQEEEATLTFFSLVDVLAESDIFKSQPLKNLMGDIRDYAHEGLIRVEVSSKDKKTQREELLGNNSSIDIPNVDVSVEPGNTHCSIITLPKDFTSLAKEDPVKTLTDIAMSASFARDYISAWMMADTRKIYAFDHHIEETSGKRARAFVAETYLELQSSGVSIAKHANNADYFIKQFPEGIRSWGQQSTLQYDQPYKGLPPRKLHLLKTPPKLIK